MIKNPGFEGRWYYANNVRELQVAESWVPWWHQTDRRPEFKAAVPEVDPFRIHSGQAAQQWFTSYSTHTGGIYQQVPDLTPGTVLTLTAWVQAFTRHDDANFRQSDGRYRMRIGIDPYGGVDPESRDIIWSEVAQPYDHYIKLTAISRAASDRATIFIWGQAEWGLKHNNGYVDDVELIVSGEPSPEPGDYVTRAEVRHIAAALIEALRAKLAEL